jgi:NAD(P)-dependent dehydrogenase (short-subunit alcohol dehydrogenase family)
MTSSHGLIYDNRENRGAIMIFTFLCDIWIVEGLRRIEQKPGGLDILVNNAATNPYYGPAIDAPESTLYCCI